MGISLFDLAKPVEKNPATGGGINSQIILIQESDINWSQFPARDVVDGVTITQNIPLKAGKYFHRLYLTQGTIKPAQKKLKGSNQDCGGYQITLEGFYPGLGKAIQKWITNFGVDFKGLVIIQNCSAGIKYLVGEACNLVTIESIDSTWGEEVDKEKGSKIIFTCKQSVPMAFYEGAITFDPSSASW